MVGLSTTFYSRLYYLLIVGLIIGGTYFTKFQVLGTLYLHDSVLILGVLSIVVNPPRFLRFPTVIALGLISIFYLILSIIFAQSPLNLIIRQYAIFGYLLCYYFIFLKAKPINSADTHNNFLVFVAALSCVIQAIYVIYLLAIGASVFDDYNYYSPAIVLGLILASAAIIVFIQSFFFKMILLGFVSILSATSGHSSAVFSIFIVAGSYFLFNMSSKSKIILIVLGLLSVLSAYLFLPQFSDDNASFRLITWSYTLNRILLNNLGVWGEGFGIPYFDKTLIFDLYNSVGMVGFFGIERIHEGYLSSVHNSFLTIFLSIGLLPGMLIFYPLVRLVMYLRVRHESGATNVDFIFLSLIGLIVWSSFNEILELPHSSGLFWMVYFCSLSVSWSKKSS